MFFCCNFHIFSINYRPYCTLEGEIDHTAIYKDIEVFTEVRHNIYLLRYLVSHIYFVIHPHLDTILDVDVNPKKA